MGELLRLAAGLDTQVKELTVAQRPVISGLANGRTGQRADRLYAYRAGGYDVSFYTDALGKTFCDGVPAGVKELQD